MKEIIGKVSHYVTYEGGVKFSFDTLKTEKQDGESIDVVEAYGMNFPFEIWKKFKNAKVKITIEKV